MKVLRDYGRELGESRLVYYLGIDLFILYHIFITGLGRTMGTGGGVKGALCVGGFWYRYRIQ